VPIGLALAAALSLAAVSASAQTPAELRGLLRDRVAGLADGGEPTTAGERVLAPEILGSFYAARGFAPVWASPLGAQRLAELVASVRLAERHGLDPTDYHLDALERLSGARRERPLAPTDLVDLELLASDAFVALGTHLLRGRAAPSEVDPEWLAHRRSADLGAVLASAAESGRIAATLFALAPRDPRYAWLVAARTPVREAVARGGWPTVPDGPGLELGARDARVAVLRERLAASEDLPATATTGDVFDAQLDAAVRRFQARHGLVIDGVVGRATLAALDVSAEERLRQIDVNLERWRWLPADLGARHIEVNVPAYDLRVVESGAVTRRHRVVVGLEDRETPMVSGLLTEVVLSPYWNVPASIAGRDLLPAILADPALLATQGFVLLERATGAAVDPAAVDWPAVADSAAFNARYRLRQDPGPRNALGAVKFTFSNGHAIYLHDTPARHLFELTERDFSSGCIRVENAMDLAVYVLADSPEWTRSRIEAAAASGVEVVVPLRREIPVHLMYWTAWVDDDGTLELRDDVYGRDEIVRRALAAPPRCS
jgi:murein L,D-transpeptidase YcbB/YkuD